MVAWVAEDLDEALNEATVAGLRLRPDGRVVILLHVLTLPEHGPADPDPRRALVLSGVSTVRVLLRRERPAESPRYGPAIPLRDFDAVEEFFASIAVPGSMYGWKFLDDPDLTDDWPSVISLAHTREPAGAAHSLYWFNECGLPGLDGFLPHCIEGVVDFTELAVERFDGSPIPVEEFTAAGRRWWRALFHGDRRTSVEAQRAQDPPPSWRPFP
ncbi:hypothetical protein H4696_002430 [Amycolatopsis lexingtonensis]|uniref:Uncharacterized protein n=1 Tax=Amycolatopsis lexingtonensis TaxID=218822 RepID=A0ABR9HWL4_9PSEU|nr:hypothetical protein [Amycolatopsis lexingtonensis]MBE1495330.1 hypothetical protein [Amycolatopsis lexingtonensis]